MVKIEAIEGELVEWNTEEEKATIKQYSEEGPVFIDLELSSEVITDEYEEWADGNIGDEVEFKVKDGFVVDVL